MSESIRVLIVEDSEADARLMLRELRRGGYDPIYERVDTPEAMSATLDSQTWDIIISDYSMPRFSGLDALKLMQEKRLDLPFIMVSGKMGEETAIETMKAGAHDYILKQNMSRLIPAIARELREAEERRGRRHAEESLRQSEERYRTLFESMMDAYVQVDMAGHLLEFNPAYQAMLGYTDDELRSLTFVELTPEPWRAFEEHIIAEQILPSGYSDVYEKEYRRKNGTIFPVELRTFLLRDAQGQPAAMWAIVRDITERKLAEERLYKLNRTLTMLSSVNQLLIRARDESGLLHEACRIIVEQGGYAMAWVGLAEDDREKIVRPVTHCGREEGYLDTIKITWSDTVLGQSLTGTAIRTGLPQIVHDIHTEPRYAPWREEALKRGYGSAIAVPLMWDGKGVGALSLFMDEPDSISKEEIDLLMELASDMTYGVMSLRARVEAASAEAHKRDFYRRTILAATEGKLIVCERDDVVRIAGPVIASWDVRKSESLSIMRNEIARIAADAGMEEHRLSDFVLCIGEAATNAFKHAGGGAVSLHKRDDAMIAVVSDQGPGIEALVLPELAFKRGYTTAASLGMGYKAMISMADKLYLATDPGGTTVGIEMGIHPPQTPSLIESLPDVF